MAQLTVRKLDSDLVQRLKIRAALSNRSAEAEHRAILEAALRVDTFGFWERAAKLRAATRGRSATDGASLIREDRDRDHRTRQP
jgi:plasmid stability protein